MAVTDKAKVAALTGIAEAEIQDDWITWVQDLIENRLGTPFGTGATTELLDGKDRDVVFLSKKPVTAVTSVKVSGVALDTNAYKLYGEAGYIRMLSSLPYVVQSNLPPMVFPAGVQNIEVQYTYEKTVSPRVEATATQMVAHIARAAKAGLVGTGGVSYSVGQVSVTNQAQAKLHSELVDIMKTMLGPGKAKLGGFKAAPTW